MKDLDWFSARGFMRKGAYFRRLQWQKWLFYQDYVWSISQTVDAATVTHVVLNSDFGKDEFLANDWTDEPWDTTIPNPHPAPVPPTPTPSPTPTPIVPPWVIPDPNNPNNPNSGGGTFSGGGGGGSGGGSSGGNGSGNTPIAPSISLSITDALNGGCFDTSGVQNIALLVEVNIPSGPAGTYLLDCKLSLQTQLSTAYAGYSGSFGFVVPVTPGSSLTATATVTVNGQSYTATGTYTAPGLCGPCHEPTCCPGEDGHKCGQMPNGTACCCCPAYYAPVGPNCSCVYVG